MKKLLIFLLILLILFGAGFYFKDDLTGLYLRFVQKIAGVEKASLNLANQVEKQINAPVPLRSELRGPSGSLTKVGVISLTNTQRINNGLVTLKEKTKLDQAAVKKAQDLLNKQYFEHISPLGVGPAELAKSVDYDYLIIGENLAMGNFKDDEELVQAWMNSPGHRANILDSRYQEIGVAVIKGEYEGSMVWMAVQEFGLPLSACPQPDLSIKAAIDSNSKQINSLLAAIEIKRQEIENLSKSSRAEYNSKVSEYNELVRQYNLLVGQAKTLISTYNLQVAKFNQCASQ